MSAGLRAYGPGATDNTYGALDIERLALAQMSPKITDKRAGGVGFVCFHFADESKKVQSKLKIDKRKIEIAIETQTQKKERHK